jgi:hypothetical protein
MIARFFIAISLVALSTAPALAIRGSGRIDPKPDEPALTKGYSDTVFSCMIWEQQDGVTQDYASFTGTSPELSETLSGLRSWHPQSVWGCN